MGSWAFAFCRVTRWRLLRDLFLGEVILVGWALDIDCFDVVLCQFMIFYCEVIVVSYHDLYTVSYHAVDDIQT